MRSSQGLFYYADLNFIICYLKCIAKDWKRECCSKQSKGKVLL